MQKKTCYAFGYIATRNSFTAGETLTFEPIYENVFTVGAEFQRTYIWLYTKGTDTLINVDSGETIVRTAGDCTLTTPYPIGSWRTTLPEDIELWCFSVYTPSTMARGLPNVEVFRLAKDQEVELPQGTKLFLATGVLQIDTKYFSIPSQIELKSGAKTVRALSDVYGFIFV